MGINNKVFTFTPKSEINFIPKDSSNSTIDFWSSELNEVNGDATLNINGISKNISFILAGTLYYSGGDIVSERASVYITIKLNIDNYAPILIKDPFDDATVNYFNNKEVYIIKSTYGDMDSFRRSSSSTYSIDITKPNPIINCLFYR